MANASVEDFSWNSSYIQAFDNETGWGTRYFFTYFSQFDERPFYESCIEALIFGIIFLSAVVANVSIIICVAKYPDMQTVTNCFVFNLASADIIFTATIPVVATTRITMSWKFGDITCKIVPYAQFVSGVVLLWTLALISVDRYRCIVVPPYRSKMSPCQASLASLVIWMFTSFIFSPLTFWFRQITTDSGLVICTLVFPKSAIVHYSMCFVLPTVLFACLIPMVILVFYYQRIFRKILSTKNAWATSCVMISAVDVKGCNNRAQTRRQSELSLSDIFVPWPRKFSAQFSTPNPSANARHGSLSHHEEIRLHKHIKVVRLLFLNVLVVLLMWLPITIIMFLIFVDGRRENDDKNFFLRSQHFIIALGVAYVNTVVNPLLYGLLSDNFRTCMVKIWCQRHAPKIPTTPSSGRHNNNAPSRNKKPSVGGSLSEKSERSAERVDRVND